jgi:hypothetical protein
VIKMAAQLGAFDLTKYGVSDAMVATMDTVVQVAIAAGLEALKDAGIVKGDAGLASWQLPEHMRDSTGVVYATSFPALEAAVSEVMRFLHSKQKSLTQVRLEIGVACCLACPPRLPLVLICTQCILTDPRAPAAAYHRPSSSWCR